MRPPPRLAGQPVRPFCSERCKLIDLGGWLEERNAIPGSRRNSGGDTPKHRQKEGQSAFTPADSPLEVKGTVPTNATAESQLPPGMPRASTRNAHWLAQSSTSIQVGFPAPWPARVSMRMITGFGQAWACCSAAANLKRARAPRARRGRRW